MDRVTIRRDPIFDWMVSIAYPRGFSGWTRNDYAKWQCSTIARLVESIGRENFVIDDARDACYFHIRLRHEDDFVIVKLLFE